jgi:hypothetical protein
LSGTRPETPELAERAAQLARQERMAGRESAGQLLWVTAARIRALAQAALAVAAGLVEARQGAGAAGPSRALEEKPARTDVAAPPVPLVVAAAQVVAAAWAEAQAEETLAGAGLEMS